MKNNRIFLRRRLPYSTRGNKIKIIKTPGNRLNVLKLNKKKSPKVCPIEKSKIRGVIIPGSRRSGKSYKKTKTVSRIYGGCLSGQALRKNIIKAFLLEEKRLAKKVLILSQKKIK